MELLFANKVTKVILNMIW